MTVFKPHEAPAGPPLSEREREVLEAIASGATNREIAGTLFLSPHTVKEHTSSLYRKLKRAQPRGSGPKSPASGPHLLRGVSTPQRGGSAERRV